ncbi:MAG TPA: RNA methyltransferase [Cyclobacteriaceae bacterium]|nr:RNA methyltransferase [Cyclobacteriaceae bacterium]
MPLTSKERLLAKHFSQYVSEHKKEFIEKVLSQRTRHVTVALEDIYQSQNASAVVRTCECMGLQDIHIIENTSSYQTNTRVLKGSNKWMDLIRYRKKGVNNTEACIRQLKESGYTIYAADPAEEGISIHDIDIVAGKTAILFGNELHGVSNHALAQCDHKVRIPMYGFTESLNISVSVAICLNTLINKLHQGPWEKYGLGEDEKEELTLQWYRKVVRKSDLLEREFLRTIQ